MNRYIHYFLGYDLCKPEQLREMFKNTYNSKKKDMLMLTISFSNLSSIFVNAGEISLGEKFNKISNIFLELYYCDFYTKQAEKKEIKASKAINKYKKFVGYDNDGKAFCRDFGKLIEKTFTNINSLTVQLPVFNGYNSLLFRIGHDTLTEEECKLLVKNFKRKCKDMPLFEYELSGFEKGYGR